MIALAWEGHREHDNAMAWAMYRAALKIRPPPTAEERRPKRLPDALEIRAWAQQHNQRVLGARTPAQARQAALERARDGIKPKT